MQNLRACLIQAPLAWEDISTNLSSFDHHLSSSARGNDLVLLPEMFNTGFTMNTEKCSETMDGRTVSWLKDRSRKYQTAIAGSVIISENQTCFNRFILVEPDGSLQQYDKRHLFQMGDEHLHFTPGQTQPIFKLKGWKLSPQICYDLRFPVWSRKGKDYDVLMYLANWPEIRSVHWEKLLQARAIENQCYVLAVNRIGRDGHGTNHIGCSGIIDFMGEWQQRHVENEIAFCGELDHEKLMDWHKRFPVNNDADTFTIIP